MSAVLHNEFELNVYLVTEDGTLGAAAGHYVAMMTTADAGGGLWIGSGPTPRHAIVNALDDGARTP